MIWSIGTSIVSMHVLNSLAGFAPMSKGTANRMNKERKRCRDVNRDKHGQFIWSQAHSLLLKHKVQLIIR